MCAATFPSNILILVNVRWWNANAFYAVNLARILDRQGHRVWVGCGRNLPAHIKARKWGLRTVDLDFQAGNPLILMRSFQQLLQFIRRNAIQVINSHRPEDSTFGWLAQMITGVKHIVTRGDQRPVGRGRLSRLRYQKADAVVLTCLALWEQNREVFDPIGAKIEVIHGSVDEDRFKLTPLSPARGGRLQVGWVGRLDPVKDPETFLNAAALVATQYPDVDFVLAGAPANLDRDAIVRQITERGLADRLTLLPRVPDIAALMAQMDLGVITSVGSEVISRVLLEFLALGKPVMGSRVNTIAEIIQPGINGDLFSPGDYRTLAELLLAWVKDARRRRTYAQGAAHTYGQSYSTVQFYRQYQTVLDRVAG